MKWVIFFVMGTVGVLFPQNYATTDSAKLALELAREASNWNNLINIPAGFADGIDNTGSPGENNADSLGGLPASAYLLKSDSTIFLTPYDAAQAYQPKDADLDNPDLALNLVQDSLDVKANRSELGTGAYATIANYSLTSHTHTEFFDTLKMNINILDTVIAGDNCIIGIENNITITQIRAFTNTGTVTFNFEERNETTPNTAGTDVMTSDLTADTDQQKTTTFSNATLDRDDWLALVVTSKTGDPTLFGIEVRYVKTN